MDRSINKIAQELLVHSEFEPFANGKPTGIAALETLGTLEQFTSQSLAVLIQKVTAPNPPPATGSNKAEYKAALADPSLVEALLAFHEGALPASRKRVAPARNQTSEVFAPASIPEIQAELKLKPFKDDWLKRRAYSTAPVLRG